MAQLWTLGSDGLEEVPRLPLVGTSPTATGRFPPAANSKPSRAQPSCHRPCARAAWPACSSARPLQRAEPMTPGNLTSVLGFPHHFQQRNPQR